jgi:hypothetical protein
MGKTFLLFILLFLLKPGFSQDFKVDYLHGRNDVYSISIIDDNVWIGGYLGLTRINRLDYGDKELIIDPFIDYSHDYCFGIFTEKDNNGNLFVHDCNNLYKYESGFLELIDSGLYINDFFVDENNCKWILNSENIIKIDSKEKKYLYNSDNSSLPNYYCSCITAKNDELWLGSFDDGLVMFNGSTSQTYNSSNSMLPHDIITAIAVDRNDNIWLAYHKNGVYPYYDEDYTLVKISGTNWTIYNKNNSGLPSTVINDIIPIGDNVFLCTTGSLIKFDGSTWVIYNQARNQFLSDNIKTVAFEGNNIWVGTDHGISVMSADSAVNIKLANTTFSGAYQGPIIKDFTGNIWVGTSGSDDNLNVCRGGTWETIIHLSRLFQCMLLLTKTITSGLQMILNCLNLMILHGPYLIHRIFSTLLIPGP